MVPGWFRPLHGTRPKTPATTSISFPARDFHDIFRFAKNETFGSPWG
jgi:hypothetical protein